MKNKFLMFKIVLFEVLLLTSFSLFGGDDSNQDNVFKEDQTDESMQPAKPVSTDLPSTSKITIPTKTVGKQSDNVQQKTLLEQIQSGTKLKHVDTSTLERKRRSSDVENLSSSRAFKKFKKAPAEQDKQDKDNQKESEWSDDNYLPIKPKAKQSAEPQKEKKVVVYKSKSEEEQKSELLKTDNDAISKIQQEQGKSRDEAIATYITQQERVLLEFEVKNDLNDQLLKLKIQVRNPDFYDLPEDVQDQRKEDIKKLQAILNDKAKIQKEMDSRKSEFQSEIDIKINPLKERLGLIEKEKPETRTSDDKNKTETKEEQEAGKVTPPPLPPRNKVTKPELPPRHKTTPPALPPRDSDKQEVTPSSLPLRGKVTGPSLIQRRKVKKVTKVTKVTPPALPPRDSGNVDVTPPALPPRDLVK